MAAQWNGTDAEAFAPPQLASVNGHTPLDPKKTWSVDNDECHYHKDKVQSIQFYGTGRDDDFVCIRGYKHKGECKDTRNEEGHVTINIKKDVCLVKLDHLYSYKVAQ